MNNYIDYTVKSIGDYALVWDVVNEAIDDNTNNFIKESPWKPIDDFVCKAFMLPGLLDQRLEDSTTITISCLHQEGRKLSLTTFTNLLRISMTETVVLPELDFKHTLVSIFTIGMELAPT
jgi:hypothetical protein